MLARPGAICRRKSSARDGNEPAGKEFLVRMGRCLASRTDAMGKQVRMQHAVRGRQICRLSPAARVTTYLGLAPCWLTLRRWDDVSGSVSEDEHRRPCWIYCPHAASRLVRSSSGDRGHHVPATTIWAGRRVETGGRHQTYGPLLGSRITFPSSQERDGGPPVSTVDPGCPGPPPCGRTEASCTQSGRRSS